MRIFPSYPPCPRCRQVRRVMSIAALSAALLAPVAWRLVWASPSAASAADAAASPLESGSPLPGPPAHAQACHAPAEGLPACPAVPQPVELDVPYAYQPSGQEGKPYRSQVKATGGNRNYRYRVVGDMPPGLKLDPQGQVTGTPTRPGTFQFTISASDGSNPPLEDRRAYRLTVHPKPTPARPAASAAAPRKDDDAALLRQASDNEVVVYQLRKEDVDALMPEAGEPAAEDGTGHDAAADAASSAAGAAHADVSEAVLDPVLYQWLHDALTSMQGIEYPTQSMFEHALDARIAQAARAAADRPSRPQCKGCSVPASLRDAIIKAAQRRHDYAVAHPQQWEAGACGCRLDDLTAEVYGFQPFWTGDGAPQRMDFSVMTRVGYFALPFDAFGNLPQPLQWSAAEADFVRIAHDHGTRVDLVLYRNRWDALLKLSDETRERIAHEVPRHAVQMIRTSMVGWRAGVERKLPGFAHEPRMGDGITVFFDGIPTDADGPVAQRDFDRFFDTFVLALIDEMRRSGEPYALNLVIPAQAMGHGPFAFAVLSGYIRKAEDPLLEDGQIGKGGVNYRSRTNLTLQFLVPMPDPVTQTKRELRARIEEAPPLHGNDRRVFLRKVIPLLSADGSDLRQLGDDLVYFQDNFGGVGFWPVPQRSTPLGDAVNVKLRQVYRRLDSSDVAGVCRLVCPQRWLLRLAFELLLLVGFTALAAYASDCRLRRMARGYLLFVFIGAIAVLALGAAMLSCDPALTALRDGNALLLVLIAALVGWAVWASLRRSVEKP